MTDGNGLHGFILHYALSHYYMTKGKCMAPAQGLWLGKDSIQTPETLEGRK